MTTAYVLALLAATPWLLAVLMIPIMLMRRIRISGYPAPSADTAPLVSIIIPARNEAVNISTCLASVLNSVYPNKEIIVVDDGSSDGTPDIVRILAEHSGGATLRLIESAPLPDGWLGKPWACWQGYRAARGDLLLFTDADTRHEDTLLGHAVGAQLHSRADLVTVLPRQLMESFWERTVLPQIFTAISIRYHNLRRVNRARNPRAVVANGQFLLIRREAYEHVGGHEELRAAVVEDLQLAQTIVAAGRQLFVAHAEDLMETRMYRSLRAIIEGWSRNLALGSRMTVSPALAHVTPWVIGALFLATWVAPPAVLIASFFTPIASALRTWSIAATALSLLFWFLVHAWMRIPRLHAIFFPLGALVVAGLFFRSALRGSRVAWKGREYHLGASAAERVSRP